MGDVNHANHREIATDDGAYRGQVRSGSDTFHGYGLRTTAESTALGEWQDGRLNGLGRQSWPDGRMYSGEFLDGAFSGHGRMHWRHPRGIMVYDGEYLKDKKHGHDKFTWPSGKAYEGQWMNGQRHGIGVDTSVSGCRCRGMWEDNVFLHSVDAEHESDVT